MNKKGVILAAGLLLSLGGVATSSALLYQEATASTTGNLDQGLVLNWDDNNTTTANITNLTYGSPQNQHVTVAVPTKSASVGGYATVTFTLTGTQVSPLSISVYTATEWEKTTEKVAAGTLDAAEESHTEKIDLKTFNTAVTYYVEYSLTAVPQEQSAVSAKLTISLGHSDN